MPRGYDTSAFKKRLAKIPRTMRKHMREAIEKDADEWVKMARILAPADPKDGTPLRDSIKSQPTETGGQTVTAGGPSTTKPVKGGKGGEYDYAGAQEFGTSDMAASPFFWPAYRLLKKKFESRRKRALAKAIKEMKNG